MALQRRHLLWQLLVGVVPQTQPAVIAVAERKELPVRRHHRRVFEPARHLKSETGRLPFAGDASKTSRARAQEYKEELADLHHLLPLQGFDLPGSTLAVAVAVAQLAVVAVPPAEHLAALRQGHGVAVAAARRHQLSDHEAWRGDGARQQGVKHTEVWGGRSPPINSRVS